MMKRQLKIIFLTSTNLASNPRCRKEIELALAAGHKVSVVAFEMDNWTREKEKQIREQFKDVDFYYLSATRSNLWLWFKSTAIEKISGKLYKLGIRSTGIIAAAVNRRTVLIQDLLRSKKLSADLIIAHNPGAFYPAVCFASRNKAHYAIDVEDYHPGEGTDPFLRSLNEHLLQKVLPAARYISYASEPIMQKVLSLVPQMNGERGLVINNAFPAKDFPKPAEVKDDGILNFVWFSQNIDASRGLEQILPVLDKFKDNIRLTLVGSLNKIFFDKYLSGRSYISIIAPLLQEDLHALIGQFDIGLAIEPGKDVNNNLALSNKAWTYFQAGLYILASGTEGQESFIRNFAEHGIVTSLEEATLQKTIALLINDRKRILERKISRWQHAQNHSWTVESSKVLGIWGQIDAI
jgi:hypothetical protein